MLNALPQNFTIFLKNTNSVQNFRKVIIKKMIGLNDPDRVVISNNRKHRLAVKTKPASSLGVTDW